MKKEQMQNSNGQKKKGLFCFSRRFDISDEQTDHMIDLIQQAQLC